jgi:hypothetical protein
MAVKAQIGEQKWAGYYLGNGDYAIRCCPKQTETVTYTITSSIPGFTVQSGQFVVNNVWPSQRISSDYIVGPNWYTDRTDLNLFVGIQQGAKTVQKWRDAVLLNWGMRWAWLQ